MSLKFRLQQAIEILVKARVSDELNHLIESKMREKSQTKLLTAQHGLTSVITEIFQELDTYHQMEEERIAALQQYVTKFNGYTAAEIIRELEAKGLTDPVQLLLLKYLTLEVQSHEQTRRDLESVTSRTKGY